MSGLSAEEIVKKAVLILDNPTYTRPTNLTVRENIALDAAVNQLRRTRAAVARILASSRSDTRVRDTHHVHSHYSPHGGKLFKSRKRRKH